MHSHPGTATVTMLSVASMGVRALVLGAAVVIALCAAGAHGALPPRPEVDLARASDAVFVGRVMHVVKREVVKSDSEGEADGVDGADGDGSNTGDSVVLRSKWSDFVYEVYANVRSQVRSLSTHAVPGHSTRVARPSAHASLVLGLAT